LSDISSVVLYLCEAEDGTEIPGYLTNIPVRVVHGTKDWQAQTDHS
jgi:hypothetical protein